MPSIKPHPNRPRVRSTNTGSATALVAAQDGGKTVRALPDTGSSHYIFRKTRIESKPSTTWEVRNATVSIDGTTGGQIRFYVFDAQQQLIEAFSSGENPFIAPDVETIEGTVGFLDDRFSIFNICHLLLDKVTRIGRLPQQGIDHYFLVTESAYATYLFDCLGLSVKFGLSGPRKQKRSYKVDRLLLNDASFFNMLHPGQGMDAISREFIQQRVRPAISHAQTAGGQATAERLYVSRQGGRNRKIVNAEEVAQRLQQWGFEPVLFEKLSVAQQLQASLNAKVMLGVHGAGLTNGAYMAPGNQLLELLPPMCATPAYWSMGRGLNLRYDALITRTSAGESVQDYTTWTHDVSRNKDDVLVDLPDLDRFLTHNLQGNGR